MVNRPSGLNPLVLRMVVMGRADQLSPQRAFELGLVGDVVPLAEVMPTAERIAEAICAVSPAAAVASKMAIMRGEEIGLTRAIEESYDAIRRHGEVHPDAKEGPRAWVEKRAPRWVA